MLNAVALGLVSQESERRGRHDACGRPRPLPAPQLSCCNSRIGFTNSTKIGGTEKYLEATRIIARVVFRNSSPKNALLPAFGRWYLGRRRG